MDLKRDSRKSVSMATDEGVDNKSPKLYSKTR